MKEKTKLMLLKQKIKPIMGKSIKDEELINIIKFKNEKFENAIKEKCVEFRNKRIKTINETTNFELEKRICFFGVEKIFGV